MLFLDSPLCQYAVHDLEEYMIKTTKVPRFCVRIRCG